MLGRDLRGSGFWGIQESVAASVCPSVEQAGRGACSGIAQVLLELVVRHGAAPRPAPAPGPQALSTPSSQACSHLDHIRAINALLIVFFFNGSSVLTTSCELRPG